MRDQVASSSLHGSILFFASEFRCQIDYLGWKDGVDVAMCLSKTMPDVHYGFPKMHGHEPRSDLPCHVPN